MPSAPISAQEQGQETQVNSECHTLSTHLLCRCPREGVSNLLTGLWGIYHHYGSSSHSKDSLCQIKLQKSQAKILSLNGSVLHGEWQQQIWSCFLEKKKKQIGDLTPFLSLHGLEPWLITELRLANFYYSPFSSSILVANTIIFQVTREPVPLSEPD